MGFDEALFHEWKFLRHVVLKKACYVQESFVLPTRSWLEAVRLRSGAFVMHLMCFVVSACMKN